MALLLPIPLGHTGVIATFHQVTSISLAYGPDGKFVTGALGITSYLDANATDPIAADSLKASIAPPQGQDFLAWAYAVVLQDAKYVGGQPAPDPPTAPPPAKP